MHGVDVLIGLIVIVGIIVIVGLITNVHVASDIVLKIVFLNNGVCLVGWVGWGGFIQLAVM